MSANDIRELEDMNMIPEEEQNRINSERKAAGGEELEKIYLLDKEPSLFGWD